MVKGVAPDQTAIEPCLRIWAGGANLAMVRTQIVLVGSWVAHRGYRWVGV